MHPSKWIIETFIKYSPESSKEDDTQILLSYIFHCSVNEIVEALELERHMRTMIVNRKLATNHG